jgi:[ribosomal protein S5]-alanine N-acetyltransferase
MQAFTLLPFQNLSSERLLLRKLTPNDVNEMFAIRSNEDVMKYIPRPLCKTKEEVLELITLMQNKLETNEACNWAITLKNDDKLIGFIGHYNIKWEHFRSEIGYMLAPKYHGKGIATESTKLLVDFGFNQMKMHSLEAIIDPANVASARVLEKNGFVKEAHLKENGFYNGKFLDTIIYSLIKKAEQ